MGNRTSKPLSSWDVLGIAPGATLPEIKRVYCRQAHTNRNDPDALLRINDAYAAVTREVPFSLYTPEILDKEYDRYAPDFFARLELCYNLHPRLTFTDGEFTQFYRYWLSFRHEDGQIERQARTIVRRIKARDPRYVQPLRVIKVGASGDSARGPPGQGDASAEPKVKAWKFLCHLCNRGFNSENTLRDHLKSRRHFMNEAAAKSSSERAGRHREAGGADLPEMGGSGGAEQVNAEDAAQEPGSASCIPTTGGETGQEPFKEAHGIEEGTAGKGAVPTVHGTAGHRKEHEAYRTCHYCKKVLPSRGQLILHIKEAHS